MKNKLEYLFALQLIDTELDTLQEQKGDLPFEVQALENELAAMRARQTAAEQAMRQAFSNRDTADSDIVGLREKLDKYKGQQFSVRSNREYDALTREMDAATESVARLEKEMAALEIQATTARTEMEELKGKVEVIEKQLAEKQAALAEVSKLTEEEELQHQHEREKAIARITKQDLAAYERIRKAKKLAALTAKAHANGQRLRRLHETARAFGEFLEIHDPAPCPRDGPDVVWITRANKYDLAIHS